MLVPRKIFSFIFHLLLYLILFISTFFLLLTAPSSHATDV